MNKQEREARIKVLEEEISQLQKDGFRADEQESELNRLCRINLQEWKANL